jgi:acetyl esterase
VPGPFADEQLAAWVAEQTTLGDFDVADLREGTLKRAATRLPGPELDAVRELDAGGRTARLYRPVSGPLPVVLYLHGGGWTIGNLDTHDRVCRQLAVGANAAVLALDYRLAPEHPWPASIDDAMAVLRWIAGGREELGERNGVVAVAGDSAGGALAALACQRLRTEDPEALPALQVLINANCDLTGSYPSMREKESGWGLEVSAIRFFNAQWVPDPQKWGDRGVSPLAEPDLSGLPPAIVITSEHDPLRDEAEAYAQRLSEAGVQVWARREPGLIHNFVMLDEVSPACAAAADRLAAEVGERLRSG